MRLPFISELDSPVGISDWYLLILIVSFLLSLFVMGPYIASYLDGLSVMYRFNSPDSDIRYPEYSPFGKIVVVLLSCINLGLGLSLVLLDLNGPESNVLSVFLKASVWPLIFFFIRIFLYQIVNSSLYRSQTIMLKTSRWNNFFIMVFSASGFCILVLTSIALFLEMPSWVLVICMSILLLLAEIGLIFKIKTSLFKNKCSNTRFISYLCALELGPIMLLLVLLGVFYS